ncbi:hypothetical protein [Bartonella raoultii]|nr:hypothetical protein [Bartonella raoultii]
MTNFLALPFVFHYLSFFIAASFSCLLSVFFYYIILKRYRIYGRMLQALKNSALKKQSTIFLLDLKATKMANIIQLASGALPMVLSYNIIETWLHRWIASAKTDWGSLIFLIPQIVGFLAVFFIPIAIVIGMFFNCQLRKNIQQLVSIGEQQEKEILISKARGENK